MPDFDSEKYDSAISLIKSHRTKGEDWDHIRKIMTPEIFELTKDLFGLPEDLMEVWDQLVENVEEMDRRKILIEQRTKAYTISDGKTVDVNIPRAEYACWNVYKELLKKKKGFSEESVETIESECLNILKHLRQDTPNHEPVKGLVVGSVQSGKTANMAGLMAMAADKGWNLFIVLTGTIDSLRKQTQNRLHDELFNDRTSLKWTLLEQVSSKRERSYQLSKLHFGDEEQKYLVVCLKNKKRLKDLFEWLNSDIKKKSKLRILLIDDEADQASVNTAKPDQDRKTINQLIVNIVDNTNCKEQGYASMNYVCYTATPYANFLSEGSPESLYPRNFITVLKPANIYFGPTEIFGLNEEWAPGLNIINSDYAPEEEIADLMEERTTEVPAGLCEAICWFICCTGIQRLRGYRKPVTMLIHTSVATADQKLVTYAVDNFLKVHREDIRIKCREVYAKNTSKFSPSDLCAQYPNRAYGIPENKIKNYPEYSEIEPFINELLSIEPTHIKFDAEENICKYHRGIHICLDNSSGDTIENNGWEDVVPRLFYPNEKENPEVDFATAFIVIGGNTLSRGLTLEGLVSTYFGRAVRQMDTLVQMGRWFGYRLGYEILPRIWISEKTRCDFETAADVDYSLRDFIKRNYNVYTPAEFPPLVKKFPKVGYLLDVTAKSKRQGAVDTDYDFSGQTEELTTYYDDKQTQLHNADVVRKFISELGPLESKDEGKTDLIWRNVPGEKIFEDLMVNFDFNQGGDIKGFNELNEFKKWLSENKISAKWNVIFGSVKSGDGIKTFEITPSLKVNKISRSARRERQPDSKIISISSLSSPSDRIADVEESAIPAEKQGEYAELRKNLSSEWHEIRKIAGIGDIPVLILYCIDKDSKPRVRSNPDGKNKQYRFDLNASADLIGITVLIPGDSKEKVRAKYQHLPKSATGYPEDEE